MLSSHCRHRQDKTRQDTKTVLSCRRCELGLSVVCDGQLITDDDCTADDRFQIPITT